VITSPENLKVFSEMECNYYQTCLRKKSASIMEQLSELHATAKTTIEVLSAHLAKPDVANYILFTHYSEVNRNNVIKLLLRGTLLYQARRDVTKVFKYIIELEHVIQPGGALWRILQDNGQAEGNILTEHRAHAVQKTLTLLSKVLASVTIFQTEHKLFNGEFYFKRKDYRKSLVLFGQVLSGFLKIKGYPNPDLLINGSVFDTHEKEEDQLAAYHTWFNKSIQVTGKLEGPKHFWDTKMHRLDTMVSMSSNKKKHSRIDETLSQLPPRKQETIPPRRAFKNISQISSTVGDALEHSPNRDVGVHLNEEEGDRMAQT
jgi:hypothetical protein